MWLEGMKRLDAIQIYGNILGQHWTIKLSLMLSVESCACRVITITYFQVIRTCYSDVVLIICFNEWLINFIDVGIYLSYIYNILKILFPIWRNDLSCGTTACSFSHCKECQARNSIHRQISYTMECRKVSLLFKSYSKLWQKFRVAVAKVIVITRSVSVRLCVQGQSAELNLYCVWEIIYGREHFGLLYTWRN